MAISTKASSARTWRSSAISDEVVCAQRFGHLSYAELRSFRNRARSRAARATVSTDHSWVHASHRSVTTLIDSVDKSTSSRRISDTVKECEAREAHCSALHAVVQVTVAHLPSPSCGTWSMVTGLIPNLTAPCAAPIAVGTGTFRCRCDRRRPARWTCSRNGRCSIQNGTRAEGTTRLVVAHRNPSRDVLSPAGFDRRGAFT